MNKHLEAALKKIRKCDGVKDRWTGYLRPDEIIALAKDGAGCDPDYVKYAKEKKAKGSCESSWFYFKLGRTTPHQMIKETRDGDLKRRFNK